MASPSLTTPDTARKHGMADTFKRIEDACFSLLYEVAGGNGTASYKPWVVLLQVWGFIQMLGFPFSQAVSMPWSGMPLMEQVYVILRPITLNPSSDTTSAGFFSLFVLSCAFAGCTLLVAAVGVWLWMPPATVTPGFQVGLDSTYRPVWLPRFLRFAVRVINGALFVPIVSGLLSPVSCGGSEDDPRNWDGDSTWACWQSPHMALVATGFVLAAAFVGASALASALMVNRTASSKDILAAAHGRVFAGERLLQAALCLVFALHPYMSPWVLIIACALAGVAWLIAYIAYQPYYSLHMNQGQGAAAAVFCLATGSAALANLQSADRVHNVAAFVALICSPLAAFAGWSLVANRYRSQAGAAELPNPYAVELRARWMLSELHAGSRISVGGGADPTLDTHDAGATGSFRSAGSRGPTKMAVIRDVTTLYGEGCTVFSSSAFLELCFATFLGMHASNRHLELIHLSSAGRKSAPLDIRWFIHQRRVQLSAGENSENGDDDGKAKTSSNVARRMQFEALRLQAAILSTSVRQHVVSFWSELLERRPSLQRVEAAGIVISTAIKQADAVHRSLLAIAPTNPAVLRQYAIFLLDVANEPRRALELIASADQQEEEAARAHTSAFNDVLFMAPAAELHDTAETVGVVRVSSNPAVGIGSIVSANSAALRVCGYTRREALGRDMGVLLIPDPISGVHSMLVRRYLKDGHIHVIDQTRVLFLTHRSGHIVPVRGIIRALEDGFFALMEPISTSQSFVVFGGATLNWRVHAACASSMNQLGFSSDSLRAHSLSLADIVPKGSLVPPAAAAAAGGMEGAAVEPATAVVPSRTPNPDASAMEVDQATAMASLNLPRVLVDMMSDTGARVMLQPVAGESAEEREPLLVHARLQVIYIPHIAGSYLFVMRWRPVSTSAASTGGSAAGMDGAKAGAAARSPRPGRSIRIADGHMVAGEDDREDKRDSKAGGLGDGEGSELGAAVGSVASSGSSGSDSSDSSSFSYGTGVDSAEEGEGGEAEDEDEERDEKKAATRRARAAGVGLGHSASPRHVRPTLGQGGGGGAAADGAGEGATLGRPPSRSASFYQRRITESAVAAGPAPGKSPTSPQTALIKRAAATGVVAEKRTPHKETKGEGKVLTKSASRAPGSVGTWRTGASTNTTVTDNLRMSLSLSSTGMEASLVALRRALIFIFMLTAVMNICALAVVRSQFSGLAINIQDSHRAGDRAIAAFRTFSHSHELRLVAESLMLVTDNGDSIRDELDDDLAGFMRLHIQLYGAGQSASQEENELYTRPTIPVEDLVAGSLVNASSFRTTRRFASLANAGIELVSHGRAVLASPIANVTKENPDVFWLMQNGPTTLQKSFLKSMEIADSRSAATAGVIETVSYAVLGVALGLFVSITLFVMLPGVHRVVMTKNTVFEVFLRVPHVVLRSLRSQTQAQLEMAAKVQAEYEGADGDGMGEGEDDERRAIELEEAADIDWSKFALILQRTGNMPVPATGSMGGKAGLLVASPRSAALAAAEASSSASAGDGDVDSPRAPLRAVADGKADGKGEKDGKAGIDAKDGKDQDEKRKEADAAKKEKDDKDAAARKAGRRARVSASGGHIALARILLPLIFPLLVMAAYYSGRTAWTLQVASDALYGRREQLLAKEIELASSELPFFLRIAATSCDPVIVNRAVADYRAQVAYVVPANDALLYGDVGRGLRSGLQVHPEVHSLFLKDGCIRTALPESGELPPYTAQECDDFMNGLIARGVQGAFQTMVAMGTDIMKDREAAVKNPATCKPETLGPLGAPHMWRMQQLAETFLSIALGLNSDHHIMGVWTNVRTFQTLDMGVTAASIVALVAFYITVYRPFLRRLDVEIKSVRRLLLLFPDEVSRNFGALGELRANLMSSQPGARAAAQPGV